VLSGGGDAAVSTDGGETCATDTREAKTRPLDIFILLDQSGSMTKFAPNRWEPTVAALKAFISGGKLDGIGVGLNYFPQGTGTSSEDETVKCNPTTYQTPAVPIALLPDNAKALSDSIDAHHFTSAQADDVDHYGTPTTQALTGVFAYLGTWHEAHPDHSVALFLATDGEPLLCGPGHYGPANTPDTVTEVIAAAAAAAAPLKTFVIGIGEVQRLDDWAAAGGTGQKAFIVDINSAMAQLQFLETLTTLQRLALPCDYAIPSVTEGSELDPGKVNVEHAVPGKDPVGFSRVPNQASCQAGQSNWYYDDAAKPTKVIMCPGACADLAQGGSVNIVYGCATHVAVVN
jgi:hypothetical protein